MAKLVIGNNKTVGVPAITKKVEELPALGLMRAKDANGKLIASTTESRIMDFTGVTDVDNYMLTYAYYQNTAISGAVDMSDLTTLSGQSACSNMFDGCTGITSEDLSSLTTVSGADACSNMFNGCTSLTSVNLSALTTIISGSYACQYMFARCTGLASANLPALTTISGANACQYMFSNCTGLTSVSLSSLTTLSGRSACSNMFNGCTSLSTVYLGNTTAINFGSYTNQFNNMFNNCTQNIDVYAPAASQSAIEAFSGYPNFGGTGTVTWHWNTAE